MLEGMQKDVSTQLTMRLGENAGLEPKQLFLLARCFETLSTPFDALYLLRTGDQDAKGSFKLEKGMIPDKAI